MFKRSSKCKWDEGQCVEVDIYRARVLVRDSKNPGVVLHFDHAEWAAFTAGVRMGEFDVLAAPAAV